MQQEEAVRAMIRDTDAGILALEIQHRNEIDHLENANYARNECLDRAAKNLPPDNDNPFWRRVTDYLATSSTSTPIPMGQTPPPATPSCSETPPPARSEE